MAPGYPSSPMTREDQVPGRECSGLRAVAPEHSSPPTTKESRVPGRGCSGPRAAALEHPSTPKTPRKLSSGRECSGSRAVAPEHSVPRGPDQQDSGIKWSGSRTVTPEHSVPRRPKKSFTGGPHRGPAVRCQPVKGSMPHLRGRVACRLQLLPPSFLIASATFWQGAWRHLMHGSHPASSGVPRDNVARPKAPRLPPCCVRRIRPGRHAGLLCGCLVGPLRGARCQTPS